MIPRLEWSAQWSLKYLEWKARSKISCDYTFYSIVKFARLDDTFSEIFELEASPVEDQSLQQKYKTEKEKKNRRKKI